MTIDLNPLARMGHTPALLKLPHVTPTTDDQHAANARHLERWGNDLPFGQSTAIYIFEHVLHPGDGSTVTVTTLNTTPGEYYLAGFGLLGDDDADITGFGIDFNPDPTIVLSLSGSLIGLVPVLWEASSVQVGISITNEFPVAFTGYVFLIPARQP